MFYCQFFLNLLWSCRCENSASQGKRTKIIGAKCVSSLIRHIPFSRVRCVSMNLIAFLPISFFLFLSLPLFCECFIPLHWFFFYIVHFMFFFTQQLLYLPQSTARYLCKRIQESWRNCKPLYTFISSHAIWECISVLQTEYLYLMFHSLECFRNCIFN